MRRTIWGHVRRWPSIGAALLGGSLLAAGASAQSPDNCAAEYQALLPRLERAGRPDCVAPRARHTYGPKYHGYYVGGGALFYGEPDRLHGEPRYSYEGTFGMDYDPWYSRVRLQWFHGTRYQQGEGQYEPDHKNNPLSHFFGR